MISKENMEQCKEAIFMSCKSKGNLHIGGLMQLRSLLNTVLNDTTTQQFRLYEASKFLCSQGYIEIKQNNIMYGNEIFFATDKLWIEMNKLFESGETSNQHLKNWF